MAAIRRRGTAVWMGDLRGGKGQLATQSGVLEAQSYSFRTRFENGPGTNPEELIAAAHAGCYSMALANTLDQEGYNPESIETTATITLAQVDGGFAISEMHLDVRGQLPGIDQETFERLAEKADGECPMSNLLRSGLELSIAAELI